MKLLHPNLKSGEFPQHITVWRSPDGLNVNYSTGRLLPDFQGVVMQVATLHTPPYVIINQEHPSNITGYLVDLLGIFCSKLNFRYNITPVADGEYGLFNGTHWTGVIGAVSRGVADLALANLAPNLPRSRAVHFLDVGVGFGGFRMLLRKPDDLNHENSLLAYLKPLSKAAWVFSAFFLLLMSFSVCMAHHVYTKTVRKTKNSTSTSRERPKSSDSSADVSVVNSLQLKNVIFVALQTAAQQGRDQLPEEASTRVLFLVLWLMAVLIFTSYSATLTSFFTHTAATLPFDTAEELLKQTSYTFGFQKGTSYLTRVNSTNSRTIYTELSLRLEANPSYLVSSLKEGLDRARKGKYVFMHEQKTLKWLASQSCEFIVIGPAYMKTEVTLAVQHNSLYFHGLRTALVSLHENGIISRLQEKWWPKQLICDGSNGKFRAFSLTDLMLPMLLLTFGLVGGFAVGIVETLGEIFNKFFVNNCKKLPRRSKKNPRKITSKHRKVKLAEKPAWAYVAGVKI